MQDGEQITVRDGEPFEVVSHSQHTLVYRVSFPGCGWVQFTVPPGGGFQLCATSDVRVDIQDVLMSGLRVVEGPDTQPS
ncbi:hypothetical protein [Rubellimicrobium arenae]|uniref:hypothetical protein n=1 Tax=Rubellimicrobium arenae TaxID=2817372 RepID=UPI001B317DD2|nr:hypothetical protein [Rubellimicrobium arenae]